MHARPHPARALRTWPPAPWRNWKPCCASAAGQIAALIVEPLVQGAAGMAMYDPSYLDGARALCDRYRIHLIADEIAVGCGRTGTFFAWEQARAGEAPLPAHLWPDFLCLSKGISGGYLPLSLVLSRPEIQRAFVADELARSFLHSHSYTGNPLACRAALATLDLFAQDDCSRLTGASATSVSGPCRSPS